MILMIYIFIIINHLVMYIVHCPLPASASHVQCQLPVSASHVQCLLLVLVLAVLVPQNRASKYNANRKAISCPSSANPVTPL